jgi:hypothetical protein
MSAGESIQSLHNWIGYLKTMRFPLLGDQSPDTTWRRMAIWHPSRGCNIGNDRSQEFGSDRRDGSESCDTDRSAIQQASAPYNEFTTRILWRTIEI